MSDIFKVLIVVDVQNCFMYNNNEKGKTFLNLEDAEDSLAMAKEIASLDEQSNLTVFTRDYHPINHISLKDEGRVTDGQNSGLVWPRHCRNATAKCKRRNKFAEEPKEPSGEASTLGNVISTIPSIKDEKIALTDLKTKSSIGSPSDIKVYGPELSFMFYFTPLKDVAYTLNAYNKAGDYKIGLEDTMNEIKGKETKEKNNETNASVKKVSDISPLSLYEKNGENPKKHYITLTKGEHCNQESYSAFNYHIAYTMDDNSILTPSDIAPSETSSTGLWEFILKMANEKQKKNIEITVCGLVGNVCVIHSVLQGISMWNNVYADANRDKTVTIIYSLKGTRFTTALYPEEVKPEPPKFDEEDGWVKFMTEKSPSIGNQKYKISVADEKGVEQAKDVDDNKNASFINKLTNVVSNAMTTADDTKATADDTKATADETNAKPDETNAKPDETNAKPDETNAKPDETNAKPDETNADANTVTDNKITQFKFADYDGNIIHTYSIEPIKPIEPIAGRRSFTCKRRKKCHHCSRLRCVCSSKTRHKKKCGKKSCKRSVHSRSALRTHKRR